MWNLITNSFFIEILFLMIISHILVCFSIDFTEIEFKEIKTSITIKSFIWSIFIHSPIILSILYLDCHYSILLFLVSFIGGWFFHILSEDAYYRMKKIYFKQKEFYSIIQIILIWLLYIYN